MKYLPIASLLIITLSTNAEIITDGTLGQNINLPGPDFQIDADLGQQHGGNLFHSFQDFNLNSSESATFSGPNSVQNILSRVTGGNPSNIDGLIRSTIPNADMYFLNPYGIMFGPNSKLDVQGSFHASTADYLRLGENGRFDARNPGDSLLTVAPVEAFGFLTDTPASITTQDSVLSVSNGKTLSLIGGDLELNGSSSVTFDEGNFKAMEATSKLTAKAGRINLVSMNSGELINQDFKLSGKGGDITLNKTLLETSGENSGSVFIRAGKLVMQKAVIQANTLGNQDGQEINIEIAESIDISGNMQSILSKTFATGKGGDINIVTPNLTVNGSIIDLSSFAEGNGGDIKIHTTRTEFIHGGASESNSFGKGKGGNFFLEAEESLSVLGQRKGTLIGNNFKYIDFPSKISTSGYGGYGGDLFVKTSNLNVVAGSISAPTFGKGNAGNLTIQTDNLSISEGAFIASSSAGTGDSGTVNLTVKDTLSLFGRRKNSYFLPSGMEAKDNQSAIVTFALSGGNGGDIFISAGKIKIYDEGIITSSTVNIAEHSGDISIETDSLHLSKGGQINSSNGFLFGRLFLSGPANSGSTDIKAKSIDIIGDDLLTGIFSDTYTTGQGGNISIQANNLTINEAGAISARGDSTGNAGQITVQADNIYLTNQGNISTKAENAAGGNILINPPRLLYLQKGEITTSVGFGKGKGGDIDISNPQFTLLNQSQIKAQADAGHGGNINLKSDHLISSPNSQISASSRLGLDGNVTIESPDMDIEGALVTLKGEFKEASDQIKRPCSMRGSSFTVQKIAGSPQTPYDYKPAQYLLEIDKKVKTVSKKTDEKLAFSTCKRKKIE
ncbi:filamentous hemagglutinin N-terminal domain-containing protein [Candidatus Halobeggiatoa sp. HSG11]|nr:filamentous hemagglutinin N-terminal domain-containing protein [Candidatus Halobeggiatoa sp. HSG11]